MFPLILANHFLFLFSYAMALYNQHVCPVENWYVDIYSVFCWSLQSVLTFVTFLAPLLQHEPVRIISCSVGWKTFESLIKIHSQFSSVQCYLLSNKSQQQLLQGTLYCEVKTLQYPNNQTTPHEQALDDRGMKKLPFNKK